MAVISHFECIFRESDICFYFVVIQRGGRDLVDDPGCEAFPFHWTLGVFSTVALSIYNVLRVFPLIQRKLTLCPAVGSVEDSFTYLAQFGFSWVN